ncbi:MAG: hypothetical protein FWG96_01015 [Methanomassiliicoccaceae archaeon]|nr:hypothetical protein [Methanomassiliicoccaceae archaeon]
MTNINGIRPLYLARYAPGFNQADGGINEKEVLYANYHRDVHDVLKKHFPEMISSDDLSCLLSPNLRNDVDYIFSLYNRMPFKNSEIFVSSLAEYHQIPYLGAPPNIRAVGEDKHLAKIIAGFANVPTIQWKRYDVGAKLSPPDFEGPYFVKPRFEATSLHINEESISDDWSNASKRIQYLNEMGYDAILEKQIFGKQYASPIIHNFGDPLTLPCVEETSNLKGNVITFNQKRMIDGGLKREVCRDEEIQKLVRKQTEKMMDALGPIDYVRFDYIIDEKSGIAYFSEFNICCNLGKQSSMAQSAKSVNIDYENLIENILFSSLQRNKIINK